MWEVWSQNSEEKWKSLQWTKYGLPCPDMDTHVIRIGFKKEPAQKKETLILKPRPHWTRPETKQLRKVKTHCCNRSVHIQGTKQCVCQNETWLPFLALFFTSSKCLFGPERFLSPQYKTEHLRNSKTAQFETAKWTLDTNFELCGYNMDWSSKMDDMWPHPLQRRRLHYPPWRFTYRASGWNSGPLAVPLGCIWAQIRYILVCGLGQFLETMPTSTTLRWVAI